MKAIIFDVDNTLLPWKKEYVEPLKKILLKYENITNEDKIREVDHFIDEYELYYNKLTKEFFLDFINKKAKINLPIEAIDELIELQGNLSYVDKDLTNTLEYLSSKYDLYAMSNWFYDIQYNRLKNAGIARYFQKIYGGDTNYIKPNKEAYEVILLKYLPGDCLFIGDTLKNDVVIPEELGMNVIWKTKEKSNKYCTIENLYLLKEMI